VERYVDLLEREMGSWAGLGSLSRRPLSTVHLGGGTPTVLGEEPLERLVLSLRALFVDDPATEWALESSVVDLPEGMLNCLHALGFRRLHVGVQSLDDSIRSRVRRRAAAVEVLKRLAAAIGMGWTVSVDLIYGLPGQTLLSLLQDIRILADLGVHGFSLYELQRSRRNRRFIQESGLHRQDRTERYWMAQACAQLLTSLGYPKTLFNHFASHKDTNLYFTFPTRGEDLLALGAISDGSFGNYHYQHPQYAAYCRATSERPPGLKGGLRRNRAEDRLMPLTTALLSGTVPVSLLSDLVEPRLVRLWRDLELLGDDPGTEQLRLTGNGSWFVGNMISDLLDKAAEDRGDDGSG
jgi:oxygen-independent coproporphyrinogen-3 oxidase